MALTPEKRRRIEEIQAAMLEYVERASAAVEDVRNAQARGGTMLVDREVYYALLAASTTALDRDDAERERRARGREVLATLIVAAVATAATVVQAYVAVAQ